MKMIATWCVATAIVLAALMASGSAGLPAGQSQPDQVGKRPYELDWAGRTQDQTAPLVDFEDLGGWRVETHNSVARFERTREQQIWGDYVGKLTYRADGPSPHEVRILPPTPIPIGHAFDTVTVWCYGNNWGWTSDPSTPQVGVTALFEDAEGREFRVYLYQVDWTEWYLLHRRLAPDQIARVRGGGRFVGLLITNGRQKEDRTLYFDNVSVFSEQFPALTFAPRAARGIDPFPGQSTGTNTGPGKLPFPTRPETILPKVEDARIRVTAEAMGNGARFVCSDRTGQVVYAVTPRTGRWDDIEAVFRPAAPQSGETRFRPSVDGGVWLATASGPTLPEKCELLESKFDGKALETRWRVSASGIETEVTYRMQAMGKSLVIDTLAPGGRVADVRFGRAVGLADPRLTTHPFYPADGGRPATVCFGPVDRPLFVAGNVDWYRTNASTMWATDAADASGVTYNGGVRYTPLTDGRRLDCFERFLVTVSSCFEETLPTIANPVSPWKKVTGTHLWRAHGAGDREADKRYWADVHRYGMTQVVITDHETMWRDGGESFTFRTRTAPGRGGDESARAYSRYLQDTLGFVYGPYNNFTDFAPVNEYWRTDMIARDPENQLQHAWMRCYAPKPARAVEYCEKLSPINQAKFGFSTAYCDVHTAVPPWHRVDYDPRVPGAGSLSAVFYSYGEIMLLQKKAWNGPVYSEGNFHAFYCGLTDGNYGQDQSYRPAENPWLVDFDLRRMHDLGCNFGMGNTEMFYANVPQPQGTREEKDRWLDRFLAATVAFGHPGFLVMEGGYGCALRSYYMLQQLHSRYCLASAAEIRYAGPDGRLLSSSQAVATGAYKRSQVVTRYSDGTVTAANGSTTDRMRVRAYNRTIDLPPNGYCGWTADGSIEVRSADQQGRRADYSVSPAYLYVDGRGRFARFPKAAGDGIGICRILPGGRYEVILYDGAQCGFAIQARKATALDKDRKPMGPAELRVARGLCYVMPVKGAFSYLLEGRPARVETAPLTAARTEVVPGEKITIKGARATELTIPADAVPGSRLWRRVAGQWLDFTVLPVADVALSVDDRFLKVSLTSHMPATIRFDVSALGKTGSTRLAPGEKGSVVLDIGAAVGESAEIAAVTVRSGGVARKVEAGLRTALQTVALADMPSQWVGGVGERGKPEQHGFGTTGARVTSDRGECGGVAKASLLMHPAWLEGAVGYAYALFAPVALPPGRAAAFRAVVGKLDGSDPGDGILYRVVVIDASGKETAAAQHVVRQHRWEPIEADLSRWAGQTVRLKLIADPGAADNSGGDWACWSEMRIETLEPILHRSLDQNADRYRRAPAPYPIAGLALSDVRSARRGWIRYDGKGLNGGAYRSFAYLNGVEVGAMAEAGGDEVAGRFAERVGIPLPPEAIRQLNVYNAFEVRNPNHDYFSIRRAWIELELADGRRCSTEIADVTYTQPGEWAHAEGIGVSFAEPIVFGLWFRLER